MLHKKSQMQMGETIAVLIIFFFIVGFGLIFFGAFQKDVIIQSQSEMFEKTAVQLALKAAYLPEIVCSSGEDIDYNCVDLNKAYEFSSKMQNSPDFANFYTTDFGYSRITLKIIYPYLMPDGTTLYPSYEIYNNAPGPTSKARKITTFVPVTVINPMLTRGKDKLLGIMEIENYLITGAVKQP